MGWTAIRRTTLSPVPWPNGRGITRDYVVRNGPDGQPTLRVTLADLTEDAPFSLLPGTDRVFTLATGGPVELTVDGLTTACERLQPFRFRGGATTTCRLPNGPAQAFNLFYDPAAIRADVAVLRDGTTGPGEHFLFSPDGGAEVAGLALDRGDLAAGIGPTTVRGTVLAVSVGAP